MTHASVQTPPPALRRQQYERHVIARGDNDHTRIQNAIDGLQSGRSQIATVVVHGDAEIGSTLSLPDYTRLDVRGRLKAASGFTDALASNENNDGNFTTGNTYIEVFGHFEGNGSQSDSTTGSEHGLLDLEGVAQFAVSVECRNSFWHGFRGRELYGGSIYVDAFENAQDGCILSQPNGAPGFTNPTGIFEPFQVTGGRCSVNGRHGWNFHGIHDSSIVGIKAESNTENGARVDSPINLNCAAWNLEHNGDAGTPIPDMHVILENAGVSGAGFSGGAMIGRALEVSQVNKVGCELTDNVDDGDTRYTIDLDFRFGIGGNNDPDGFRINGDVNPRNAIVVRGTADGSGTANGKAFFISASSPLADGSNITICDFVASNLRQYAQLGGYDHLNFIGGSARNCDDGIRLYRDLTSGSGGPTNLTFSNMRFEQVSDVFRESDKSEATFLGCPLNNNTTIVAAQDGGQATFRDCPGLTLANWGSGAIADTDTSTTINHGLDETPTSVTVTPQGDERLWVSSVGATSFDVNRSGSSGARNFYWEAKAGPALS